jgi:hypothetical protein
MDLQEALRLTPNVSSQTKNEEGEEKQSKLKPIKENHRIASGNQQRERPLIKENSHK